MAQQYVIVPGYQNSGAEHWQSVWEVDLGAGATRIVPASWDRPECEDWVASLGAAMTPGAVIVAHSLGCLAAATWLERYPGVAGGAFLVALPDAEGPDFPPTASGFGRPRRRLADPVLMIGSSDDPYSALTITRETAATIGARLVEIGAAGHISTASGRGPWAEGRQLLAEFVAGLGLSDRPGPG